MRRVFSGNVLADTSKLTRDEWLEIRRKGVGGSDIAAACGVSPWVGPYELWLDKTGILPRDQADTEMLEIGREIEKFIAEMFRRRNPQMTVERPEVIYQHPEHHWALYTPDGRVYDPDLEAWCLMEIKNVSTFAHMKSDEWQDNQIPFHYYCQCQWGMLVVGADFAWFPHLVGGNRYKQHLVERDDEVIAHLLAGGKKFWEQVEENLEPSKDGTRGCARVLEEQYRAKAIVEISADLAEELTQAKQAYQASEENLERVKNEIKAKMKKGQIATCNGAKVASWTAQLTQRLDTKKLQIEQPEIYQQYLKTTTSNVFRQFC